MSARLSVVVPTYNRAALLRRTLDSLVAQRFPAGDLEVVVADDGSGDATADVVRSYADRLRLRYHFQEDLGFRAGAARNAGARLASAPVLAFLDTGALANPGFARAHLDAHRGRAAVVGYTHGFRPFAPSPALDDELLLLPPVEILARIGHERCFRDMRQYQFELVDYDLSRLAAPWYLFWSGNISVRADDFRAVGGFDEEFQDWGAEDVELGYRLTAHGIPIVLSRDAWSIELPHERDRDNDLTSRRNMQLVLEKHRTPLVELCAFVFLTGQAVLVEDACRPFLSWLRRARTLDVRAEIEAAVAGRTSKAHARVAVVGCGGTVPPSWATDGCAYTLLDFDRDLLDSALADGTHTGLWSIGLRTGLPDKAFDLVVVSSRLRGLWEQWGGHLLAEAHRIGHDVRIPFR